MDVLEILEVGPGASLQDRGRKGWRRFGVPPGGAMDNHAMHWANRLLNNPPDAPVIELLLRAARFRALCPAWIAVTGADGAIHLPTWRAIRLHQDQLVEFRSGQAGVWTYVAVEGGGFAGESILGSVSAFPRGELGHFLQRGETLASAGDRPFQLPDRVAGRFVSWQERRDYHSPPLLRVWPGPQWALFTEAARRNLFEQEWTIAPQSDRAGYRLQGTPIPPPSDEIVSEPVLVGSIQVPSGGQPIVTMRDGPTVGGYPKIGVIDPSGLSWLAQCRPLTKIRFTSLEAPA